MTTQAEFFQTHAVDGKLTDAQMLQLLELPEGETSTLLEGGEPSTAAEVKDQPAGEQGKPNDTTNDGAPAPATLAAEIDPSKAVILARDGVHTIPYEKLEQARQGEQHWKATATAALAKLEGLESQAQQRAEEGKAPTKQDQAVAVAAAAVEQGVDPSIFGEFTEADIAKGLKALVDKTTPTLRDQLKAELLAEVRAEVKAELAPIRQQHQQTATVTHYDAILAKHPDADSIAESKELADWIASQPTFARAGYQAVLKQGTTAEVIEFFDTFKAATGKTPPPVTPAKTDVAAAARAAIANAKPAVPASLSDIPGGTAGPADEMEAMRNMPATDLMAKLEGKTPEQIAALMARLI